VRAKVCDGDQKNVSTDENNSLHLCHGAGQHGRNDWEAQLRKSGIGKITDEIGGESSVLLFQNAVNFRPWLERLQKVFGNQYCVVSGHTWKEKWSPAGRHFNQRAGRRYYIC